MRGACWDMTSTCVQGGIPRPLGGYQPIVEPHSPAPAWNMHNTVVPKQEPMDEDRNDSGLHSGSDFQSSSPGSDSQDFQPANYSMPNNIVNNHVSTYYATTPVSAQYYNNTNMQQKPPSYPYHLGFNPLTPPSSDHMISPLNTNVKSEKLTLNNNNEKEDNNQTLTPHASPTPSQDPQTPSSTQDITLQDRHQDQDDPLKRLQMSLEKNGLLAALSPKTTSEVSADDDMMKEWGDESEDNLRMPTINSHGKVKTFKCKQCEFVAVTKIDFWEHSKAHIKADKQLQCPKCPFVTEYKHHLEYHLHKHFGSKPFKCDKCPYSCVNKSMLNSHMKSHSNIYQYRCLDCSYATKYCHSLKLHLRKYSHQPAMVLNPDGTPNPLPIIDVYGTRRGPKQKSQKSKHDETCRNDSPKGDISMAPSTPTTTHQSMVSNPFANLMSFSSPNAPMQLPFPYGFFPGALSNPQLFFQQLVQKQQENLDAEKSVTDDQECDDGSERSPTPPLITEDNLKVELNESSDGVLDLSKPEPTAQQTKNRRKGKAFKLDRSKIVMSSNDDKDDEDEKEDVCVEQKEDNQIKSAIDAEEKNFTCQYCGITFGDVVLHTIHMGYHGYEDPFKCNMCGEHSNDKVAFFLHIARNRHT